jgi:hypothetical protein
MQSYLDPFPFVSLAVPHPPALFIVRQKSKTTVMFEGLLLTL